MATSNKEEILRKIFGTDFYKSIQEQLTAKSNALKLEVADTQKAILAELKLIKTDEDHVIDIEQPLPTLLDVLAYKNSLKSPCGIMTIFRNCSTFKPIIS